jgi:hypothetical protein
MRLQQMPIYQGNDVQIAEMFIYQFVTGPEE